MEEKESGSVSTDVIDEASNTSASGNGGKQENGNKGSEVNVPIVDKSSDSVDISATESSDKNKIEEDAPEVDRRIEDTRPGPAEYRGNQNTADETKHHYPFYIGLSILFLLLLAIYGMQKMEDYKSRIRSMRGHISSINDRLSGLDTDMQNIAASSISAVTLLDLKKTLLTLDELIKRSEGGPTLSAAVASRQSIISLLKTIDSSYIDAKAEAKAKATVKDEAAATTGSSDATLDIPSTGDFDVESQSPSSDNLESVGNLESLDNLEPVGNLESDADSKIELKEFNMKEFLQQQDNKLIGE